MEARRIECTFAVCLIFLKPRRGFSLHDVLLVFNHMAAVVLLIDGCSVPAAMCGEDLKIKAKKKKFGSLERCNGNLIPADRCGWRGKVGPAWIRFN